MDFKIKEDIKPLSLFRTDPASILRQVRQNQRPVIITERGKPRAVVVDVDEYERQKEKMELMEAILEGEKDVREGNVKELKQVFRETRKWLQKK